MRATSAALAPGAEQQVEPDRRLCREAGEELELRDAERSVWGAVEDREHAERPLVVEERRGDDAVRDVPGRRRTLAGEPGIVREVVDDERLPRDEREPGDARARREPRPDQRVASLAGDGLEDELVRVLVVEEDRRGLGTEDRSRDVHDRLEERPIRVLVPAEHPCGCCVVLVAHGVPSVFVAVRRRTDLTWYGVSSGCFARTSAEIPAT